MPIFPLNFLLYLHHAFWGTKKQAVLHFFIRVFVQTVHFYKRNKSCNLPLFIAFLSSVLVVTVAIVQTSTFLKSYRTHHLQRIFLRTLCNRGDFKSYSILLYLYFRFTSPTSPKLSAYFQPSHNS